jgi:hypothetical protein
LAVVAGDRAVVLRSDDDFGDIAEPDVVIAVLGDDDGGEPLGGRELPSRADRELSTRSFDPSPRDPMKTVPTPGRRCRRSLRMRSANSVSSSSLWRSLESASQKIGWAFVSTLAMIGSSASPGRLPRMRETRSRTSFAASSTFRFSSNSTVMTDPCSWLEEVSVLIPSMVESCSSRTSVISVSTTLGLAPR